ncbi:MAG: EutN/CcmL family microcompartment protein [candidate division KSB1 bacterium]|nr:EutN/CcmL family microcompartment protein [candidate division KSB1 bacterium]
MRLAKVIGTVWAENKAPQLQSCRLYIVQPVNSDQSYACWRPSWRRTRRIWPDCTHCVVVVTSTDAAQAFPDGFAPVNASIVEVVDDLS